MIKDQDIKVLKEDIEKKISQTNPCSSLSEELELAKGKTEETNLKNKTKKLGKLKNWEN